MDAATEKIIMNAYVSAENYQNVLPVFQRLREEGLRPQCVTLDGHPHIIRAFRDTWPTIKIQRCLYHIQREGLRWLRTYPKTQAGKELRLVLRTLTSTRSLEDKELFISRYKNWVERHKDFVKSLPYTSIAFKDLKRTAALITNALPNMFHYLEESQTPSTTNRLEGFYSRLKADFRRHRGLSEEHKKSYLSWYCYFKNK